MSRLGSMSLSPMQKRIRKAYRARCRQRRRLSSQSINLLLLLLMIACPLLLVQGVRACTPGCGYSEPEEPAKPAIGIDLGTTYSCVGVMRGGKIEIIPNEQGHRTTPSYISFTDQGKLVGDAAKQKLASNPRRTVFDVKRLIGRTFWDEKLQQDTSHFPFDVVNKDGYPAIKVDEKVHSPEELSATVIQKMKQIAEAYVGVEIEDAVITVPAYFNDAQRSATRDAARIAGLNVLRIINEPTAAALAYGLGRFSTDEKTIVVYDLGGGTFDVSVLLVEDGVFEVLATGGDTHLGGQDFDQRVIDEILSRHSKKTEKTVSRSSEAMSKLRSAIERAKKVLSSQPTTFIEIEDFSDGNGLSETLTRAQFEALNKDLFKKTLEPVKQALLDAKLKPSNIDDIILVGGSTRIPYVRSMLQDFFGKAPLTSVDPDEAVAAGASIHACILNGCPGTEKFLMMDVNPLTLGIETEGGVMAKVIKRGSSIPTTKTQTFSTISDNQETVSIKVFEGERSLTRDNHLLGQFDLSGIPPAERGVPQIEVTFEIDQDGILKVIAKDRGTGKSRSVTIADNGRLSEEEITHMIVVAKEEEGAALQALQELENLAQALKRQATEGAAREGNINDPSWKTLHRAAKDTLRWLQDEGKEAIKDDIDYKREILIEISSNILKDESRPYELDMEDWIHMEL